MTINRTHKIIFILQCLILLALVHSEEITESPIVQSEEADLTPDTHLGQMIHAWGTIFLYYSSYFVQLGEEVFVSKEAARKWRQGFEISETCEDFESQSDQFFDDISIFTMIMLGCSECSILRFKDEAGLNDVKATDLIQLKGLAKYRGIEEASRGYNVYKASPNQPTDEGFQNMLWTYDWSKVTTDSNSMAYPNSLEINQILSCEGSSQSKNSILFDAKSFQNSNTDSFAQGTAEIVTQALFGTVSGQGSFSGKTGGAFKAKVSGSGEGKADLSDLVKLNLPAAFSFFSNSYSRFMSSMNVGQSFQREAVATAQCKAFKVSFDTGQLPCLSRKLRRDVIAMQNKTERTEEQMNQFFEKYGTHAIISAVEGGKLYLKSIFNQALVSSGCVEGDVQFTPGQGWCDFNNKTNNKCEFISNGRTTSKACMEAGIEIMTDMDGYAKGSPGWLGGLDVQSRMDIWLTKYSLDASILMNNPVIIDDINLKDLPGILGLALYQQETDNLSQDLAKLIDDLQEHYVSGKYGQYLNNTFPSRFDVTPWNDCSDHECRDCSDFRYECKRCKVPTSFELVEKTCQQIVHPPNCMKGNEFSSDCEQCLIGYERVSPRQCQKKVCPNRCLEGCSAAGDKCTKCEPGYFLKNGKTCEQVISDVQIKGVCIIDHSDPYNGKCLTYNQGACITYQYCKRNWRGKKKCWPRCTGSYYQGACSSWETLYKKYQTFYPGKACQFSKNGQSYEGKCLNGSHKCLALTKI